jgi:hypothetical protein
LGIGWLAMKVDDVERFMALELPVLCGSAEGLREAGYALPGRSLALLSESVIRLRVRRVFEFGSGQSTRSFLRADCDVTAVEDSEAWLARTVAPLDYAQRARLTTCLQPLRRVWLAGAPLRSWRLPQCALSALRNADLVLVDSPAWPPFREHALVLALEHCQAALIVVDDANIPTVGRFCRRLAAQNGIRFFQTTMDHGLFFIHSTGWRPVNVRRPILETLKAWRRYFLAATASS